MVIFTNIDVSKFNVIRYLVLNVVIEVIVRRGLDGLEHFHRRLSLYWGRSVSVSHLRVDRYNLLGTVRTGQMLSASVLFALTLVAYSVELGLEYAVDSRAIRYPVKGNVTRVQYDTGVCSLRRLGTNNNLRNTATIAEQCVSFIDGTYRFYRPTWVKGEHRNFDVICEPVQQNLLYEADGVYNEAFASDGAAEMRALINALTASSHKSFGDSRHPLVVINVTSADVFQRNTFFTPEAQFFTSLFVKRMAGASMQCLGFTLGRRDEDTMLVQMQGCADSFSDKGSMVLTTGTSFVGVGSQVEDNGSLEWSTQIALEMRMRVPYYFRDVADNRSSSQANATAYASFLSRSFPRDLINLNKYAIVYRFCDQLPVPVPNGNFWEEEHEFSRSYERVTTTVEEWGIILVACWVVIVTLVSFLVTVVALYRRMPDKVFGEKHLLRRWAEENVGEDLGEETSNDAFLSVKEGVEVDHITATLWSRTVLRDKTKNFG
eukprot:TRINITY_DN6546_c0_g2_i1.p1 TRINITY_DN6546_c0_g2~~TRINITY_DN6546_c0_g2_i1.p1  ORF type:complete len:511 (-),score=49.40 TRINITY_DN6546_c0_g2_i1:19-1485(-)